MQTAIDHEPTLNDMTNLLPGNYYIWEKNAYVNADEINSVHIRFTCPFCYTKYLKSGKPSVTAKYKIHLHGSANNLENRFEDRIAHCVVPENVPKVILNFMIAITDRTKRTN